MQQAGNFIRSRYFHYLLLITVTYFIAFFKLGSFPFRLWDESMFAANAYEMAENGNYMVPYFDGEVDWRNSKPLLLTWIQAGLIKLFGFSELTMRLPSAAAVTLSILMLFAFLKTQVNYLFAWIAALILLTSCGYITFHTGRTGDADALLSFFILGAIISWARFSLSFASKDFFFSCLFFALAVLTKSFAAFIFVIPVVLFACIYLRKNFFSMLVRSGFFYGGIILILASLFLVFGVREFYQPGYLDYTFNNDAARLGKVIEGHLHGWDFYLQAVFYERFAFWTLPFTLSVLLGFSIKKGQHKMLLSFAFIIIMVYFVSVSASITKLIWYDMPVYPLMAVAAAVPVYAVIRRFSFKRSVFFTVLAVGLVFFIPYRKAFFLSQGNPFSAGDRVEEIAGLFLHDQLKANRECDMTVYHYGYHGSVLCYKYMYADRGKKLRITNIPDFVAGENVFVGNDSLKQVVISNYAFDTLEVYDPGMLVRIK